MVNREGPSTRHRPAACWYRREVCPTSLRRHAPSCRYLSCPPQRCGPNGPGRHPVRPTPRGAAADGARHHGGPDAGPSRAGRDRRRPQHSGRVGPGRSRGGLDDVEPLLSPALAQAARDLADRRLTDPALSPSALARELNVSPRTLQRAFAREGRPLSSYIRRRRLEEACRALVAPHRRMTVTEIAARWQFADSGHFARAFRKYYGRTPTDYAVTAARETDAT